MHRGIQWRNAARLLILFPLLFVAMRAQQSKDGGPDSAAVSGPAADRTPANDPAIEKLLNRTAEMDSAQRRMQEKLDSLTVKVISVDGVPAGEPGYKVKAGQ